MTRRKQLKPQSATAADSTEQLKPQSSTVADSTDSPSTMVVKREVDEDDEGEEEINDNVETSELSERIAAGSSDGGRPSEETTDQPIFNPTTSPALGSSASSSALTCVLCGAGCENTLQLQQHTIATHTGGGSTELIAKVVLQHQRQQAATPTTTNVPSPQVFVCTVCGMQHSHSTAHRLHVCEHYVVCEAVHECRICVDKSPNKSSTFATATELVEHQTSRHSALVYRCQQCAQLVPSAASMRQHMIERHTRSAVQWKCAACNIGYASRELLQMHMTSAHINQGEELTDVHQIFTPPTTSAKKVSLAHTNTSHKCNICDERFANVLLLTQHKLRKHCKVREGNVCRVCQGSMTSVNDFYGHSVEHNTSTDDTAHVSCVVCGQTLTTPIELEAHALYHLQSTNNNSSATPNHNAPPSRVEEQPIVCQLCHHSCASDGDLRAHLIEHSVASSGVIECSVCRQSCATADQLLDHLSSHKAALLPLQCAMCDARFAYGAQLDHHVLGHSSDKDPVIKQALSSPAKVEPKKEVAVVKSPRSTHKPNQTAIGVFICEHCQKTFASLAALQGHSHVRNHRCVHCAKAFTTAAKLRNHQRQHRDGSPFHCDVCGKSFSRKDNLKVHYRTHDRHTFDQRSTSTAPLPTMIKL